GLTEGAGDWSDDLPPRAETPIEIPIRAVAHEGEVLVAAVVRVARRHELPVGLQDERKGLVVDAADRGRDLPPRAEARIQTAVCVVAHEGEGNIVALVRVSCGHELPIGLQDERGDLVVDAADRGRDLAPGPEA